ncbi:MAG: hypothetical protein LBT97_12370 [Planctomycetota bacterium]|jgi:hypothetical protein|nr:hypothetical protein [Planctomycetota bacterium]
MHVNYTKYFKTPDELVEFLCLGIEEQDKRLGEMIARDEAMEKTMLCDLAKKKGKR